jgi:hypothetical protein
MKSALLVCFVSLLACACTSSSTNDGSLTICRNLPVIDASTSTCSVDQALLSCTSPDGSSTEVCLSDNINGCPDDTAVGNCTSECPNGEYAAACGGPPTDGGAAPSNAPPASSCHDPQPTPAGVIFYCCPCGS